MNKSWRNVKNTKYDTKQTSPPGILCISSDSEDSSYSPDLVTKPQPVIISLDSEDETECVISGSKVSETKTQFKNTNLAMKSGLKELENKSSGINISETKSKREEVMEINISSNFREKKTSFSHFESLVKKHKRKLRDDIHLNKTKKLKYNHEDISADIVINTTSNRSDAGIRLDDTSNCGDDARKLRDDTNLNKTKKLKCDREDISADIVINTASNHSDTGNRIDDTSNRADETGNRADDNVQLPEKTGKKKKKKKKTNDFALIQQEVFTEIRKKMKQFHSYWVKDKEEFEISKDRRAPPHWTEEMKSFYFDPIPKNKTMDLKEMQATMAAYSSWGVDPADYHRKINIRSKGRYMGLQADRQLRCTNCDSNRHDLSECPRPDQRKHKTYCNVCGKQGHMGDKCPETRCLSCFRPSPKWSKDCPLCRSQRDIVCDRCKRRGHSSDRCSDLWRQFHTTVSPVGAPVVVEAKRKTWNLLWCSNCARQGHVFEGCRSYNFYNYKYPKMSSQVSKYDTTIFNFVSQNLNTNECTVTSNDSSKAEHNGTTHGHKLITASTVQIPSNASSNKSNESVSNGQQFINGNDLFFLDKFPSDSVNSSKVIEVLPKKLSKNTKRLSKQLYDALSVMRQLPDNLEREIINVVTNCSFQGEYPLNLVASMQYVTICLVGHFGLNDGFAVLKQLKQMTVQVLKMNEKLVTLDFLQQLQNYYDSIFAANCKVSDVLQLVETFFALNPEYKISDLLKKTMSSYRTGVISIISSQDTS